MRWLRPHGESISLTASFTLFVTDNFAVFCAATLPSRKLTSPLFGQTRTRTSGRYSDAPRQGPWCELLVVLFAILMFLFHIQYTVFLISKLCAPFTPPTSTSPHPLNNLIQTPLTVDSCTSTSTSNRAHRHAIGCVGHHQDRHHHAVQTQHLGKDEDQHHAHV